MSDLRGTWFDGLGSLILAVLIALTIRWAFLEAYVIPSGSMFPSLLVHDHIFVNKFIYGVRVPFGKTWLTRFEEPHRGEVIVFKYPVDESTFYIKRVIGLPGDIITYKDGDLTVNGEPVPKGEPIDLNGWNWLDEREEGLVGGKSAHRHFSETLGDERFSVLLRKFGFHTNVENVEVPQGHYFVMGDNRDNSSDSRAWGFVPMENILGKAFIIWMSCEEPIPHINILCNPLTFRWNRFFRLVH